MKLLKPTFHLLVICSFLVINSCKKEPIKPKQSADVSFTLNKTEIYQYSTLLAEATSTIIEFNNKIFINGTEYPAVLVDDKFIAFLIFPDIAIGNAQVSFFSNGKKHNFDIQIMALPAINDPKTTVTNYISDIEQLIGESDRAMDSVYKRNGKAPDEFYNTFKAGISKLNDSINLELSKFSSMEADAQMVVAKFIEASRLSLKKGMEIINEINQLYIENKLSGRGLRLCNDQGLNVSQKFECIFENFRISLVLLQKELIFNALEAGAQGTIIGILTSAVTSGNLYAGWIAGSVYAINMLHKLHAETVYNHLMIMNTNFESTIVVIDNEIKTRANAPGIYYNNEPLPVELAVQRRNLQVSDQSGTHAFISNYLKEGNKFVTLVIRIFKDNLPTIPTFKPNRTASVKTEELQYFSVTVKDNDKVKFKAISGTAAEPKIEFSSSSTADEKFTYEIAYDDKVFQNKKEFSASLNNRWEFPLNDTTVGGTSGIIKFNVKVPEGQSWKIDYPKSWMIISPETGSGNKDNINLAIQDNYTGIVREGFVTFTAGGFLKKIKITQNILQKIVYRNFERTLSSNYSEGSLNKTIQSIDSFIFNYVAGSGEPNINFGIEFSSESLLIVKKTVNDSLRSGVITAKIQSTGNNRIFPFQKIKVTQSNNACSPTFVNYNYNFDYLYFQNEDEIIDKNIFVVSDSTTYPICYLHLKTNRLNYYKFTDKQWKDCVPYASNFGMPFNLNSIYLPFRIQSGADYYYGWIRVSTINESTFKIHDLALQSAPNTKIKTGEK